MDRRTEMSQEVTMHRFRYSMLALVVLAIAAVGASAEISPEGVSGRPTLDPGRGSGAVQPAHPCNILWFDHRTSPIGDDAQRLRGLGYNVTFTTAESDLNLANLLHYNVLVIAFTPPALLAAARADITSFVDAGHGLLIHQPGSHGVTAYAPPGLEVTILDPWWCPGGGSSDNFVPTIVNSTTEITAGLTDADLSGAFDLVESVGPGYVVLAVNAAVCRDPALAAGFSGAGRVVFEDGNASPLAARPGSDAYWIRIFDWLCFPAATSARQGTWGRIKTLYR